MGVSDKDFPSSVAFDMIEEGLQDEAQRKDGIAKGKGIFAFTLKNEAGKVESWYLDLKNEGKVGRGTAPPGQKATGTSSALLSLAAQN
jgi:SCP-2 sterol transfer family